MVEADRILKLRAGFLSKLSEQSCKSQTVDPGVTSRVEADCMFGDEQEWRT